MGEDQHFEQLSNDPNDEKFEQPSNDFDDYNSDH